MITTNYDVGVVTDTQALLRMYLKHLQTDYAQKTIDNQRHVLTPFFRALQKTDVTKITHEDVNNYLIDSKGMRSTKSTTKGIMRRFFKWCEEVRGLELSLNWEAIKRKKVPGQRPTIFTHDEIRTVVENCKQYQDGLLISVLFYTGMRIGEVLNFHIHDLTGTQIRIRGKGSFDRVVHLPKKIVDEVRDHCDNGYVFKPLQEHSNHPNDKYISAYGVRDRIQAEFMRILGKKMKPHDIRHSFAVNFLLSGGDTRSLQLILGHASLETTQWYLQFTDSQVGNVYAKIFG